MTEATNPRGFSRRSFIKGVAAFTAAGALAGCTPKDDDKQQVDPAPAECPDEIFAGACRGNCSGGCFLNVHARDGRIVRTSARDLPDTRYNRICSRGVTHVGRIYSSQRLQYPMKRVGERGEGKFERITWDEAIDTIVENWKAITDEYGPTAMAMWTQSGNQGMTGVGMNSYHGRMRNVFGASYISMNFDCAHIGAFMRACGTGFYCTGNEPTDLVNSKTVVCWGSNPTVSLPQFVHFVYDARDAGAKYIVIDPVYNANAAKADWFIPINPATDGALAMGLMKVFFDKGWHDEAFLAASTDAPFLVKKSDGTFLRMSELGVEPVEGNDPVAVWDEGAGAAVAFGEASSPKLDGVTEVNGIQVSTVLDLMREAVSSYTLERTSEITGVPVKDIEELARVYHEEGPVYTASFFGADHYSNGTYNYWDMYALLFVSGNMGRSGAGGMYASLWPFHICNYVGAMMPVDSAGNLCQGEGPSIPSNVVAEIMETGMYAGAPQQIKGLFIQYTNPMAVNVDRNYMETWIQKVDFIAVADLNMTETAKYADILLPVCHWFEQVEVFNSYGQAPYMYWNDKAAEPLYESKSDFEILNLIAEGLGYGEFTCKDPEEFFRIWIDEDMAAPYGFTFDQFKEAKVVRIMPGEVYVHAEGGVFPTATGRGVLYQENPVPTYYNDGQMDPSKERTVYWEPAFEADVNSEIRAKYPYHVISEHMRTRTHTQWWECDYVKEYEPEPVVKIGVDDAAELGVKDGDSVKLFNDRGYVVAKAAVHAGYPRKVVGMLRGFQDGEFIEGHFGDLSTRVYNQCVANSICNDCAVGIEKM